MGDDQLSNAVDSVGTGSFRPLKVLVVEDDADTLHSLMLLLRTDGHDVIGVASAKGMWEAMRSQEPEAVLLDITLPDASGYQLARELRRRFGEEAQKPLLVAVTAWSKSSDRMLAQLAGFDYHLGKPYSPEHLLSILKSTDTGQMLRPGPGAS